MVHPNWSILTVTPVYKLDTLLARSGRLWISLYSFFYLDNPTGFILTDKLQRLLHENTLLARSSSLYIDCLSYGLRSSLWRCTNRIKQWFTQRQVCTDPRSYFRQIILLGSSRYPQQLFLFPYNSLGSPDPSNQQLFLLLLELNCSEASKTLQSRACATGSSSRLPSWSQ